MSNTKNTSLVDELYSDLPRVHQELGNPEGGVWRTERSCYEFIAARCGPESRTLETGLGVSTMLFVRLGTTHTSIAPWESEIASLKRYCEERGIAQDRLELIQGFSDEVLPTLPKDELDLVLIDGGHGFPTPIIDWYYAAGRLRNHGVLVIDDVQLPAVQMLLAFLDADPRWTRIETTPKWVAYRRDSEGTLQEGHEKQDFLGESRMWTHSAPRTRIFDRLRLNKKT